MSITFLSHPIHLPDFFKFDRVLFCKLNDTPVVTLNDAITV